MKRLFLPLVVLFAGVSMLSSCLKDEDTTVSLSDDTAITSFKLGTLKRTVHLLGSKGQDSTYVTTLDCSKYKFYIDQINRRIYNADSLPAGVHADKVICTVTSKNSGIILLKNLTGDSVKYYSSTDSIDFSTPRQFRIISTNNVNNYADYTVSVNVHQQTANTFSWDSVTTSQLFTPLTDMRGFAVNNRLLVYGTDGNRLHALAATQGSVAFSAITPDITLPADAYKQMAATSEALYVLYGGKIYKTTNGVNFSATGTAPSGATRMAGSTASYLYVLAGSKVMRSADEGATWETCEIDDDASRLPADNVWLCYRNKITNDGDYDLCLVGNRDAAAYPTDTHTVIWNAIEEAGNAHSLQWYFSNSDNGNNYALPAMNHLQVVSYNNGMLAIGGSTITTGNITPYDRVYESLDGGVSWQRDTLYNLPAGFEGNTSVKALFVDSSNWLWLIDASNGQVWKGRLSQLGWRKEQTSFTE